MAFINSIPDGATPAARVVGLARELGATGASLMGGNPLSSTANHLYGIASKLMCWDAAIFCAWAAKGITCNIDPFKASFDIVSATEYGRLFGANPLTVAARTATDAAQMRAMPDGCFVGFINRNTGLLRHVMIHLTNGRGAGNKNDCILRAGHPVGFEALDMTEFFGADANFNGNADTTVVFMPITGQVV